MKKSIIIIIGCLLLLGCRQEVLEPEQMIQGMFALDDGSGLTNQYLLFDNGYLDIFSSDEPLPMAGKRIWSYDASLFKRDFKQHRYTISGNKIYTSDGPSGEIELKDDILTIGGKKYSVLEGFERKPYSSIVVDEEVVVPFIGQENSFPYSIENPIPSGKLTVESAADWISYVYIFENEIRFMVRENNSGSDRSAPITLSYTGAPDVDVTITQKWAAAYIILTPSSQTMDYKGGVFGFAFSISNPREDVSVTAASSQTWITDVQVSGTTVSYKVAENYSGLSRTGTIILTYQTYATNEYTVTQSGRPVLSLTLNKSTLEMGTGTSEMLVATVNPADAPLSWSSNKTSIATVDQTGRVTAVATQGNATITVKSGEKTAACSVTVSYAVDLGLPSGLKWASYNLGASKAEEHGDYYAWGETITYYTDGHSQDNPCSNWRSRSNPSITGYDWKSYKWCDGSKLAMTKYCTNSSYGTVDNITELQRGEKTGEMVDDVARAKLGGMWRMPRIEDFKELINNTDKAATTYNGKNGYKFTSRKNSSNWIFLPSAGYRYDTSLFNYGSFGGYWSSSLYTDAPLSAYILYIGSGRVETFYGYRYQGHSVRPVLELE